jgi:hypothetical protein
MSSQENDNCSGSLGSYRENDNYSSSRGVARPPWQRSVRRVSDWFIPGTGTRYCEPCATLGLALASTCPGPCGRPGGTAAVSLPLSRGILLQLQSRQSRSHCTLSPSCVPYHVGFGQIIAEHISLEHQQTLLLQALLLVTACTSKHCYW